MGSTATTANHQSGTRPAIAAILAMSAAASLFLFWLIYKHPAADSASIRLPFLPALNALLNGLSATALLVGYTFIRARKIAAHRASMITAFLFSTLFSGQLHTAPLPAWRRALSPPRRLSFGLSPIAGQPHRSGGNCPSPCARHIFLFALRPVSAAPQGRAVDAPSVVLCLDHRRYHLCDAAPRAGKVS